MTDAAPRSGADLALLLLGSYRRLIDTVVAELAERGYADVRPHLEFALRAIRSGADSASELGRRLSVSKQAAAGTIDALVDRGYVVREAHPGDARRKRVRITPLGQALMDDGAAIFDDLHEQWRRRLGREELAGLEDQLALIVGDAPIRADAPGWVAQA